MIKLVAFDWNGTIIADSKAVLDGCNTVLEKYGHRPISLREYRNHFDIPVTKFYQSLGLSNKIVENQKTELARIFHEFYESRIAKVRTRENVRELLTYLQQNQIKAIILSNHIDVRIIEQLKRLRLDKYFDEVLANPHTGVAYTQRSKKDKLKKYMKSHNLSNKEVILIGDTIEEVEISQELGVLSVAITGGQCSSQRLKAIKPNSLISNLRQLIGIIKKS